MGAGRNYEVPAGSDFASRSYNSFSKSLAGGSGGSSSRSRYARLEKELIGGIRNDRYPCSGTMGFPQVLNHPVPLTEVSYLLVLTEPAASPVGVLGESNYFANMWGDLTGYILAGIGSFTEGTDQVVRDLPFGGVGDDHDIPAF